jgi:hypothetical protein
VLKEKIVGNLTAWHYLSGRPTVHIGLIENDVRTHMCWPGGQHLFLAHDQIGRIKTRQLEAVTMCNGIGRASLDAVSAKNAAVVIDVVNLGIAFGAADAVFGRIFGSFNVNAIRRTRGRAQKTGHAFFQTVFIALQHVRATETRLDARSTQRTFAIRIVLHDRRVKHFPERDTHAFGNGGNVF